MVVYTSITKSYLPKARVLAKSVKRFHPNWTFVLLYSDTLPVGFNLAEEPFDEILTISQLGIKNWQSWAFGHALVELCTAVKGPAAEVIANRQNADKVMYIDPDIKVFSSLQSLEDLLNQHDILLTPHLLDAENDVAAIQDNEISALKHGVYNLGFFAAKTTGQGLDFIRWWASRLKLFCRDDIPNGLFTDQRWCDLAPAFFSRLHIVRDRGCNVATWNIAHRPLSKDAENNFLVGDVKLKFYHFTSYDNGNGFGMLMRYASNQSVAHELWDSYGRDLANEGQADSKYKNWSYGQFENGQAIPLESRKLYRLRKDLQEAFPNPYSVDQPSYLNWWLGENEKGNFTVADFERIRYSAIAKQLALKFSSAESANLFIKSVVRAVKRDGVLALIRRLKSH